MLYSSLLKKIVGLEIRDFIIRVYRSSVDRIRSNNGTSNEEKKWVELVLVSYSCYS